MINGFFGPDSTWRVNISESRNVLQPLKGLDVKDAVVAIYEDGNLIETLTGGTGGFYSGQKMPVPGHSYRITASKAGFPDAEATDALPARTLIDSAWIDSAFNSDFGGMVYNLRLRIKDNPSQKNYYHVLIYFEDPFMGELNSQCIYSEDPAVDQVVYNFAGNCQGAVFDDNFFDGQTYSLKFQLDNYWSGGGTGTGEIKYIADLRSVSQAYYEYMRTAALQQESSYDPLAQPVQVYGNVKNGYGIWGGYQGTTDTVTLVW